MADFITVETGKPILLSRAEVNKSLSHIDFYIDHIDEYLQPKHYKS